MGTFSAFISVVAIFCQCYGIYVGELQRVRDWSRPRQDLCCAHERCPLEPPPFRQAPVNFVDRHLLLASHTQFFGASEQLGKVTGIEVETGNQN
jgi:hypothetical protein